MATPLGIPQSDAGQAITLGNALRRLGHCCPGCCLAADGELCVPVRFIRQSGTAPLITLLAIDLPGTEPTRVRLHQLLLEVDRCTRTHRIRVSEYSELAMQRALTSAVVESDLTSQGSYRTFSSPPRALPAPSPRVADRAGGTSARGVACPRCPACLH